MQQIVNTTTGTRIDPAVSNSQTKTSRPVTNKKLIKINHA